MFRFPEPTTHWIVSGRNSTLGNIPRVTIKNAWIESKEVVFKLYGLLTLDNCTISSTRFCVFAYRSDDEAEVTGVRIRSLQTGIPEVINIVKLKFIGFRVEIQVVQAVREVQLQQCHFAGVNLFSISVGNRTSDTYSALTVAQFILRDSLVSDTTIQILVSRETSFSAVQLREVNLTSASVKRFPGAGYMNMFVFNCVFTSISVWALMVKDVNYIVIKNSQFHIADQVACYEGGCALHAKGLKVIRGNYALAKKYFFLSCTSDMWYMCRNVQIENTDFFGSGGTAAGGVIRTVGINLNVINCLFALTDTSKHPTTGGIIYFSEHVLQISVINTTFDATCRNIDTTVSILSLQTNLTQFKMVHILCPVSLSPSQLLPTKKNEFIHFSCEMACQPNEYTLQAGSLLLEGNITMDSSSIAQEGKYPVCHPCPLGANCDSTIQVLPNYWGHKNNDFVQMIRCPEAYCCQDSALCHGITSCNTNRNGVLCGNCVANWTQSLFSQECVPADHCQPRLVLLLYILAITGYSMLLLFTPGIKNLTLAKVSAACKALKKVFTKQQNTSADKETVDPLAKENASCDETKEEGMTKYLQIFFYYVQDVNLFKVHLPGGMTTDGTIVKLLQFSLNFSEFFILKSQASASAMK